jgi:CheY-like chemotaxis protein
MTPGQTVKKIILAVDDMPVNLAVIRNILCNESQSQNSVSFGIGLRESGLQACFSP